MSAQPRYHSGCCCRRVKGIIANGQVEYALMCMSFAQQQKPVSITACLCLHQMVGWTPWLECVQVALFIFLHLEEQNDDLLLIHDSPSPVGCVAHFAWFYSTEWGCARVGSGKVMEKCHEELRSGLLWNFSGQDFLIRWWCQLSHNWIATVHNGRNCRAVWKWRRHLLLHRRVSSFHVQEGKDCLFPWRKCPLLHETQPVTQKVGKNNKRSHLRMKIEFWSFLFFKLLIHVSIEFICNFFWQSARKDETASLCVQQLSATCLNHLSKSKQCVTITQMCWNCLRLAESFPTMQPLLSVLKLSLVSSVATKLEPTLIHSNHSGLFASVWIFFTLSSALRRLRRWMH